MAEFDPADNQLTVLISVSSNALADYRDAAVEAVQECGLSPLIPESDAAPQTPAEALFLVDQADILVSLFGQRYGHVPRVDNPEGLSVSELRYNHAIARGMPVLIAIISDDHVQLGHTGGLDPLVSTAAKYHKQHERLIEHLLTHHPVIRFGSADELREQLIVALQPILNAAAHTVPKDVSSEDESVEPALGSEAVIHAADSADPVEAMEQIAPDEQAAEGEAVRVETAPLSPPDEPPAPAPLRTLIPHAPIISEPFLGRADDLSHLDAWAAGLDGALIIEGVSGIGKSMLAWEWFQSRAMVAIPDLAGTIWWSFHEGGASVDAFIRRALAFVTGQTLPAIARMKPAAREAELLEALRARPFLIVLDSLERMLGAYYRMDAAYMTEDKVSQEAGSGDPRMRRCVDPDHAAFLQKLAACRPSRVVICTRLLPADLQKHDETFQEGIAHLRLSGLRPADARALAAQHNLRGDLDWFVRVAALFDNHPLMLRLLVGDVRHAAAGDFDTWDREIGQTFSRFAPPLRRPALVRHVLNALPHDQRRVLNQIAGFRFPIGYDAILTTSPFAPPPPPHVSEPRRWQPDYAEARAAWETYREVLRQNEARVEETLPLLDACLASLVARGLLQCDREADRFDLHPVVRGYAFAYIEGDELTAIFARIRHHYENLAPERPVASRAPDDVWRQIEVYHTLISAGLLDDAVEYYRAHLGRLLVTRMVTSYQIIELLRPLFPGGPGTLPALSSSRDQGYFANELAQALGYVGRTAEALTLLGTALGAFVQAGNAASLTGTLIHYAGLLRDDRQIAAKLRVFEMAHELAEATGDMETLAVARLFLLKHYVDTGQWEGAELAYRAFITMPTTHRTTYRQATAERIYAKMLVCKGQDPTMTLDLALQLAQESHSTHEQRAVYALWGESGLQQNRPDAAEKFFRAALEMTPSDNQLIAVYSGGLARALVGQGRLDEARALVERGTARPAAAAVYLALGEERKAAVFALQAYEAAWADGPPFSFWWELEQARRILAALDIPEPALPAFDPASVRPIPHEAEIWTFIDELKQGKTEYSLPARG
jgi:tetratricopeptide (TPR) repeat protein